VFHALPTPSSPRGRRYRTAHGPALGCAFEAPLIENVPPEPLATCRQRRARARAGEPRAAGLFACYEAAERGISVSGERAGQPALRLVVGQGRSSDAPLPRQRPSAADSAEPVAEALGISLNAKPLVNGRDRKQLERLAGYITRPPLALERLSQRPDGRLELELERASGRTAPAPSCSSPTTCWSGSARCRPLTAGIQAAVRARAPYQRCPERKRLTPAQTVR
jgi:hypothetical protein